MNDRAGLDPRRPSLGDIEEVPRQLADLAVADLASCLECDAATLPAAGRRRRALRDAPARAEADAAVFATPGSAEVHAARCAARWRAASRRRSSTRRGTSSRRRQPPDRWSAPGPTARRRTRSPCARRSRVAAALAAVGAQAGAKDCALVAGAAAVDPAALAEALAELPAGDARVAVADDELARGVALVQQAQHYFAPRTRTVRALKIKFLFVAVLPASTRRARGAQVPRGGDRGVDRARVARSHDGWRRRARALARASRSSTRPARRAGRGL